MADLVVTGTIPTVVPPGDTSDTTEPYFPPFPPIPWPSIPVPATYTWVIDTPVVGGIPGPRLPNLHVAARIDAAVVSGTSVSFNIEIRSDFETPGTNLMASDMVAGLSASSVTTFATSALLANYWLWLDISGKVGTVTKFVVTLATV